MLGERRLEAAPLVKRPCPTEMIFGSPGDLFHLEHFVLNSSDDAPLRTSHAAKTVSRGTLERPEGAARAMPPDTPLRSRVTPRAAFRGELLRQRLGERTPDAPGRPRAA